MIDVVVKTWVLVVDTCSKDMFLIWTRAENMSKKAGFLDT